LQLKHYAAKEQCLGGKQIQNTCIFFAQNQGSTFIDSMNSSHINLLPGLNTGTRILQDSFQCFSLHIGGSMTSHIATLLLIVNLSSPPFREERREELAENRKTS
jgi:hypothetical protein